METITPGPVVIPTNIATDEELGVLAGETKLNGVRLSVAGATTLDIATIDPSYDTLIVRGRLRCNAAGGGFVGAALVMNNDSDDTHYKSQYLQGNAAAATSAENTGLANVRGVCLIPDGGGLAGAFTEYVIRIQDYADTDNVKVARVSSSLVYKLTTGGYVVRETTLARVNVLEAINRLQLFTSGGFSAGSSMYLYGVKDPF